MTRLSWRGARRRSAGSASTFDTAARIAARRVVLGLVFTLAAVSAVAAPDTGATRTLGDSAERFVAVGDSAERFVAVGDSIVLGAKGELDKRLQFLGWPAVLDMEVSRSTTAGAAALAAHRPGPLDSVVIGLGANDSGNAEVFRRRVREVLAAAGPAGRVYWLTIPIARPYYATANQIIRDELGARPGGAVIDWAWTVALTPGLTAGDGLHLKPEGARMMAEMIMTTVLDDGGSGSGATDGATPSTSAAPTLTTPTSTPPASAPSLTPSENFGDQGLAPDQETSTRDNGRTNDDMADDGTGNNGRSDNDMADGASRQRRSQSSARTRWVLLLPIVLTSAVLSWMILRLVRKRTDR